MRGDDPRAIASAWESARRLREVLPVLQIDAATVNRVTPRLRRLSKRLASLREMDALALLLQDVEGTDRRVRAAAPRVADDIARLTQAARTELFRRRIGNDVRRVSETLTSAIETLGKDTRAHTRAGQLAVKARVVRRAADVKSAVNAAGAVYLAGRLREVRAAVRKLRYGAELGAELADVAPADVRALARAQDALGRLADVQALMERVRDVQGSLATPDVRAWRDLDALIGALEDRGRRLHARYVRERPTLVALCDRLAARTSASDRDNRKAG